MKIFITGTDTHVGKTYVSVCLLRALNQHYATIVAKLIASGCDQDAHKLQEAASIKLPYEIMNPFAFSQPIAPNVAAEKINCQLNVANINSAIQRLLKIHADIYLFEGIGGWHVPLNNNELMSDVVIQHHMHVILVVGIKLGCLNHSILTLRALLADRVNVIGWIANCVDETMECVEENISTLQKFLTVPYLGALKFGEKVFNIRSLSQTASFLEYCQLP